MIGDTPGVEFGRVELLDDLWAPARRITETGRVDWWYAPLRAWVSLGTVGLPLETFVPESDS